MDSFRIVNLIMQSVYLPVHMIFMIALIKERQASPIWRWFVLVVGGLWLLILGRFGESVLYLFYPSNAMYTVAVYIQLIGTVIATITYVIWNLYIFGIDKLAENRIFKGIMLSLATVISVIICTSYKYFLFYDRLIMGEPVTHGRLFLPCLLFIYGMLAAGWIISVVFIIKRGEDKIIQILVFSLYPLLPGITNLVRSISGVDRIDLNPAVMSVSIYCLYIIVFKKQYAGVVAQSMEQALEQTFTPIAILNKTEKTWDYMNKAATDNYSAALKLILPEINANKNLIEGVYDGKNLKINISLINDGRQYLISIADLSTLREQQKILDMQISEKNHLLSELEEKKRNIDVYIEALNEVSDIIEKHDMIVEVKQEIAKAFKKMEMNLYRSESDPENANVLLEENQVIAQTAIASVRRVVARLKEV